MMLIRPGAAPLYKQITMDVLAPPILAALTWLFSRGWAGSIQGGAVTDETRDRQAHTFWIVLAVLYVVMISITAYGYFS